ncbi:hypothetical protein COT69_00340 [candidate division WWE3 bacterium CG09_land_8_20_14_0_10_39_24]|uniref:Uncharacterized protein n=1 Tax=candidate division WWE3 bacterium CG09_land_8_20_14_0_10_39_24 TaxID=1975088 RepID=A0A2H0WKG3_UNCKA|nr:MAG: hypothetical protein COT69_00340 [candidate division WWE3 bacterium CG09_land_8_20_14_0_10_39_24]
MNKQKLNYILLFSIILFLSFVLFSYVGIKLYEVSFNSVLGKPEELDWFLLLYSSIVLGIISGFIGSLITAVIIGFLSSKYISLFRSKALRISQVLLMAYFLSGFWMLLAIILYGLATPPCPNCYK